MPVTHNTTTSSSVLSKKRPGKVVPRYPSIDINLPGRLRSNHILALCSFSHSTLYTRMKAGTFPAADGNDGRNYWNTQTVRNYLEAGE